MKPIVKFTCKNLIGAFPIHNGLKQEDASPPLLLKCIL